MGQKITELEEGTDEERDKFANIVKAYEAKKNGEDVDLSWLDDETLAEREGPLSTINAEKWMGITKEGCMGHFWPKPVLEGWFTNPNDPARDTSKLVDGEDLTGNKCKGWLRDPTEDPNPLPAGVVRLMSTRSSGARQMTEKSRSDEHLYAGEGDVVWNALDKSLAITTEAKTDEEGRLNLSFARAHTEANDDVSGDDMDDDFCNVSGMSNFFSTASAASTVDTPRSTIEDAPTPKRGSATSDKRVTPNHRETKSSKNLRAARPQGKSASANKAQQSSINGWRQRQTATRELEQDARRIPSLNVVAAQLFDENALVALGEVQGLYARARKNTEQRKPMGVRRRRRVR